MSLHNAIAIKPGIARTAVQNLTIEAPGAEVIQNFFYRWSKFHQSCGSSFLGSSEVAERYVANITDKKYVTTLYQNGLGRAHDSSELNIGQDN